MITVYRIHLDVDRYRFLMTDDTTFLERHQFDGEAYQNGWTSRDVYVFKPKLKIPDFWAFDAIGGFAISRSLLPEFPMLNRSGELLPLGLKGHDLLFYNCTNIIDCLDKKAAIYD